MCHVVGVWRVLASSWCCVRELAAAQVCIVSNIETHVSSVPEAIISFVLKVRRLRSRLRVRCLVTTLDRLPRPWGPTRTCHCPSAGVCAAHVQDGAGGAARVV
jgi:hypothetical protein